MFCKCYVLKLECFKKYEKYNNTKYVKLMMQMTRKQKIIINDVISTIFKLGLIKNSQTNWLKTNMAVRYDLKNVEKLENVGPLRFLIAEKTTLLLI